MVATETVFEEVTKVLWVPAAAGVADPAAPLVSELTDVSVVELTDFLTKDGVNPNSNNNAVVTARLNTAHDAETPGSYSRRLDLKFLRLTPPDEDDARQLLGQRLVHGFAVVAWTNWADLTGPAAGDIVDVYEGKTGLPADDPSATNEPQKWTCTLFVRNFAIDAEVVGS